MDPGAPGWAVSLLPARVTDHLNIGDSHVTVLGVVLLHVGIGSRVLGVLLKVVRGRIADYAGGGDGVSHVLAERYAVTADFPSAAVVGCQQVLFGISRIMFLAQATSDGAGVGFRFRIVVRLRERPHRPEHDKHQTQEQRTWL